MPPTCSCARPLRSWAHSSSHTRGVHQVDAADTTAATLGHKDLQQGGKTPKHRQALTDNTSSAPQCHRVSCRLAHGENQPHQLGQPTWRNLSPRGANRRELQGTTCVQTASENGRGSGSSAADARSSDQEMPCRSGDLSQSSITDSRLGAAIVLQPNGSSP